MFIFIGNVVFEFMGLKIFGFVGGWVDVWELEEDINWGFELVWLDDECYFGDCNLENLFVVV